jgi:hypothetical protein
MSKPTLAAATDSPIRVKRVGVFLGAEITGVDLENPSTTRP